MPRVNVPVATIVRTGTGIAVSAEVAGDATNNHSVANNGTVWLEARNAHATLPKNLTVRIPGTVDGQAVTSRVYAIPALTTRRVGPFPTHDYGTLLLVDVESVDLKLTAYTL